MRLRVSSAEFQQKKNAGRQAAREQKLQQELAKITSSPAMIALPVSHEPTHPPLAVLPDEPTNGHEHSAEELNGAAPVEHKAQWSQDERRAVAIEVARLIRRQGWRHVPEPSDRTGRALLTDFLFAAQQLLPRERRRKTKSPAALGDIFWTLVEAALTTKTDLAPPVPVKSASELASEPVPGPVPEAAKGEAATPPAGQAILPEADPLRDVPLAALLQATFRRILIAVDQAQAANRRVGELEELNAMQAEDLSQMRKEYQQVQQRIANLETALQGLPKAEKKLPRVAIVGCLRYQFDHITHAADAAGLELDFRHYDQETNPTKLSADWAIILKWGSHAWQDQINSAIPAGQHIFLNGGIGMAVNQLKTWFQS